MYTLLGLNVPDPEEDQVPVEAEPPIEPDSAKLEVPHTVPFDPAFDVAGVAQPATKKVALMVLSPVTLLKVYVDTGPTETPFTNTSCMLYPPLGVIVNTWLLPQFTTTAPLGEIVPFGPAVAVIV